MTDPDLQKLHVTKLDAARRQLETAIILWFHDGDPVSIHTLAAAGYQIVYDLNMHRGGAPMMRDSPSIRPEYLLEWRKIMSRYGNFFKHADKDPKRTVFFPPRIRKLLYWKLSISMPRWPTSAVPYSTCSRGI
jgi:hypothetical protein